MVQTTDDKRGKPIKRIRERQPTDERIGSAAMGYVLVDETNNATGDSVVPLTEGFMPTTASMAPVADAPRVRLV